MFDYLHAVPRARAPIPFVGLLLIGWAVQDPAGQFAPALLTIGSVTVLLGVILTGSEPPPRNGGELR